MKGPVGFGGGRGSKVLVVPIFQWRDRSIWKGALIWCVVLVVDRWIYLRECIHHVSLWLNVLSSNVRTPRSVEFCPVTMRVRVFQFF